MKVRYARRFSRTTTTEEAGPSPSVWITMKANAKRFWDEALKHALRPLLILTVAILVCEWLGMFEHLRGVAADALSRGIRHGVPKDLLIVEITDDDYKNLFGEQSPLHPENVQILVDSVRQLNPLVIGVDLDTRDVQWECTRLREYILGPDPNIIWAQVPAERASAEGDAAGESKEEAVQLGPVLGGQLVFAARMGVVRFPVDSDGVVRTFQTEYPTTNGKLPTYSSSDQAGCKTGSAQPAVATTRIDGPVPSFFDAVARRARVDLPGSAKKSWATTVDDAIAAIFKPFEKWGIRFGPKNEAPYLKFSGDRYNFLTVQASEFMEPDGTNQASASRKQRVPPVRKRPILRDKAALLSNRIVLIGGAYGLGRDEYLTAMGRMEGVELLANAVETEIHKTVTSLWWPVLVFFDLLAGTLIVWIYYNWHGKPRWALACSGIAMFAVVLIGAFSYYGLGAFFNFVPIMAGMAIHQMYEGTKEAVELQEELARKEERIEGLEAELAEARRGVQQAPLHKSVSTAPGKVSDGAPVIRTTVVETEAEQLIVDDAEKPEQRRKGRAAGI